MPLVSLGPCVPASLPVDRPRALADEGAMRLVYPLLWSRPDRKACRAQTMATAAALARRGVEVTLLMPQGEGDPALSADDLRAYFEVEGDFPPASAAQPLGGRERAQAAAMAPPGLRRSGAGGRGHSLFPHPGDAGGRRPRAFALRDRSLPPLARRYAGDPPFDPADRPRPEMPGADPALPLCRRGLSPGRGRSGEDPCRP